MERGCKMLPDENGSLISALTVIYMSVNAKLRYEATKKWAPLFLK